VRNILPHPGALLQGIACFLKRFPRFFNLFGGENYFSVLSTLCGSLLPVHAKLFSILKENPRKVQAENYNLAPVYFLVDL